MQFAALAMEALSVVPQFLDERIDKWKNVIKEFTRLCTNLSRPCLSNIRAYFAIGGIDATAPNAFETIRTARRTELLLWQLQ